jgi:hypothetical protein
MSIREDFQSEDAPIRRRSALLRIGIITGRALFNFFVFLRFPLLVRLGLLLLRVSDVVVVLLLLILGYFSRSILKISD